MSLLLIPEESRVARERREHVRDVRHHLMADVKGRDLGHVERVGRAHGEVGHAHAEAVDAVGLAVAVAAVVGGLPAGAAAGDEVVLGGEAGAGHVVVGHCGQN